MNERAEIYRRAAKEMNMGRVSCSCGAIWYISGYSDNLTWPYFRIFSPLGANNQQEWGRQWSDDFQELKDCRVLALLFMAAMVEAGDA